MDFIINDIEKALDNGLYFIALQSVLTLPEICATLENKKYGSYGERYETWYNANIHTRVKFNGRQIWNFRCKMSHQGIASTSNNLKERICFLYPTNGFTVEGNIEVKDNIITIDADLITFCRDIINSVRTWQRKAQETEYYKKHYDELIRLKYRNSICINNIPFIG